MIIHAAVSVPAVTSARANRYPVAASRIPGASRTWNSMVDDCTRERATTYALRPELKNLKPPAIFIYGEKDMEGPPSLAREMAALAANARCDRLFSERSSLGESLWSTFN